MHFVPIGVVHGHAVHAGLDLLDMLLEELWILLGNRTEGGQEVAVSNASLAVVLELSRVALDGDVLLELFRPFGVPVLLDGLPGLLSPVCWRGHRIVADR